MIMINSLRREYDKLEPFERAIMMAGAMERKDEAAVDALAPPTLWDAYHFMGNECIFALLAFCAVHESQKGETLYWLSLAQFGRLHCDLSKGKIEEGPEADERLDKWIDNKNEGDRRARAWLQALEALDNETGGACMAHARTFAGDYISRVLSREVKEEVNFSAELSHLRELWNAGMQNSPGAPKV